MADAKRLRLQHYHHDSSYGYLLQKFRNFKVGSEGGPVGAIHADMTGNR
jgi:hypothetical protein